LNGRFTTQKRGLDSFELIWLILDFRSAKNFDGSSIFTRETSEDDASNDINRQRKISSADFSSERRNSIKMFGERGSRLHFDEYQLLEGSEARIYLLVRIARNETMIKYLGILFVSNEILEGTIEG